MNKTILPGTCPVLAAPLLARIQGMANAEGKLTASAAWRLACEFVDTKALLDAKFKVLVGVNPKRGAGVLAFAAYGGVSGTSGSCRAYADKVGGKNAPKHLLWDAIHGFISLSIGGKKVEIPEWCMPGAKVPARRAAKPRVKREKVPAPVAPVPAPAE
jgi:hypothetical protein